MTKPTLSRPRRPARPVICCISEAESARQPLPVRASAPVSTTLRAGKSTPAATVAESVLLDRPEPATPHPVEIVRASPEIRSPGAVCARL